MSDTSHKTPTFAARGRGAPRRKSRSMRRVLLLGCLLFSGARAGAQGVAQAQAAPWLPAAELALIERSFSRCLKASYQAQNIPISDARVARAWSNDLDQFSGSLTAEDIRGAPQETVAGLSFIRCRWFSEHTVVP
jgi:hypothetical protein